MKQIKFTVGAKPISQNKVYRRRKGYGLYMTDEGKDFKALIGKCAQWCMDSYKVSLFQSPSVNLKIYYDNKRANDIDGSIKLILDSMNEIVWEDDRLVRQLHINKEYDKDHPRIEIQIEEYEQL